MAPFKCKNQNVWHPIIELGMIGKRKIWLLMRGKNNYWELTDNWQMLEVVKNDVKAIIVAGFHMFKKIKILETKTAISEMKLYTGWD